MSKRAFTLIELLVVVLIIGILTAIALPQYKKAVAKSHFAEAMTNLKTIGQMQQVCQLEKGYTGDNLCSFDELGISIGEVGKGKGNVFCSADEARMTKNFVYLPTPATGPAVSAAYYQQEDVCICYFRDGHFELLTDDCGSSSTTLNYFKLLNIPENATNCACC
jgi:prepilin-type N-terminal cleavage/methylation domain-containing protein